LNGFKRINQPHYKMTNIKYMAALAAITASVSAYDIPAELLERGESRPYLSDSRVIVIDNREPAIETAYSSMMRHYYDSVWQDRTPVAPIIILEK